MRHGKKINHLGRQASHRKALMANMACSLIVHKRITTTLAKAKALRPYIEPLISKSKDDSTHSRRTVFAYLKNKEAIKELFREVAPLIANRDGGYTRILKTGFRKGDAAEMCFIELVDFNTVYTKDEKVATAKRRRRASSTTKKAEQNTVSNEEVETVEDMDKTTVTEDVVTENTETTEVETKINDVEIVKEQK